MPSPTPVTPQEFWPLFEAWARARLTPGVLWLPQGWAGWAISDFQAYTLTQAGASASAPQGGLDIVRSAHLLRGGDRVGFLFNRENPQSPQTVMVLAAQSAHQSSDDFLQQVARDQSQHGDDQFDRSIPQAQPVIVALGLDDRVRAKLQSQQFQFHFATPLAGADGGIVPAQVSVLSYRVATATEGAALPTWPDAAGLRQDGRPAFSDLPGGQIDPAPPPSGAPPSPFANLFGGSNPATTASGDVQS